MSDNKLDSKLVGMRIERLRLRHDMSRGELAEKLGVTLAAVWQWEKGVNLPATPMVAQLARALDCTTDTLLGLDGKEVTEDAVDEADPRAV